MIGVAGGVVIGVAGGVVIGTTGGAAVGIVGGIGGVAGDRAGDCSKVCCCWVTVGATGLGGITTIAVG